MYEMRILKTVMSALSIEQAHEPLGSVEQLKDFDQEEVGKKTYTYNQFHTMSDSEGDIEMVEEEEDTRPPLGLTLHMEMLAEAVSNETQILVPTGFTVKDAAVTVGKHIDPVMATSMEYLLRNKLAEKPLGEMLDSYDTPSNAKAMTTPKVT